MLKYVGNGASLPGVPARDLTDEEVEALGGEEKLIATGLYARVQEEKAVRGAKEDKLARRKAEDK